MEDIHAVGPVGVVVLNEVDSGTQVFDLRQACINACG